MGRRKVVERLRQFSWRDVFTIGLPLLLILAVGFWGASRFIKPAPPSKLIIATGGAGGAYQRYAAEYQAVFARYGIELVEQPTSGAIENVERLRNTDDPTDIAFVQGGTAQTREDDSLYSLGALYYEPVWVFYRAELAVHGELRRIAQLKGQRIAVGPQRSGNRHLAMELLQANGMDNGSTRLLEAGGLGLVDAFRNGRVDAAIVVGPVESATVWSLLFTPGLKVMNLENAEAYVRMFPYLSKVTLPQGALDLVKNIPERDITLVAPMATLVVGDWTHPALVSIMMEAVSEIHGRPEVFHRPHEFPRAEAVDFPLLPQADRYFKSGKPFLQRYLPFWAAILIDRTVVMVIPLLALLIPIFKFAPTLYNWRIRSRIFRRYGELKFIESEFAQTPEKYTQEEWLARLDAIERDANAMPTPLSFADMLYTLRGHIAFVRQAVMHHPVP